MKSIFQAAKRRVSQPKGALRFVLLIGVLSFFADFTYEGSRSITGQFLAQLGSTAAIVGAVSGFGELMGYGLRIVSGRLSEKTREFWPITFVGYIVQMSAVPLLTFAPNWQVAALLIITERIGKATRNPPRDVMLSHAASEIGYGWAFGVHEMLDQFGAVFGPLLVAVVYAARHDYRPAFAILTAPAITCLSLLVVARIQYPRPEDLESKTAAKLAAEGFTPTFWIYLVGACLVAAGFADYSLMAYHFQKAGTVSSAWIPVFYSVAMAVSGLGSLVFGRYFDRFGIRVLIPLTLISALFAPLVFLGGEIVALVGVAIWGLGMGVHESIIPAVVAGIVPQNRRPSAYGLFTAGYGIFWFLGSAAIGLLYDRSTTATIIFCVVLELVAIPFFWVVHRRMSKPAAL